MNPATSTNTPRVKKTPMEFHVARAARDRYDFEERLFGLSGNLVFPDFAASWAFYLAPLDGGVSLTNIDQLTGTPLYMAPDQIGPAAVSPASDLYAVGGMLYEILTGAPPFTGNLAELLRAAPHPARDFDRVPLHRRRDHRCHLV